MAPTPECMDAEASAEACEMSTLRRERVPNDSARKKHIFLSHSGAQKDFTEQLWKDLVEAQLSPFFDRRLPKGEPFPEQILEAARECEVAVVVISDDYFSSYWPMLELEKLMQAKESKPWRRIIPLFLKLSCEECKNPDTQERWFRQWNEWAKSENRIDVGRWENAFSELLNMSGFVFVKEVGEVAYREQVVKCVRDMVIDLEEGTFGGNQNPIQCPDTNTRQFQRLTSKLCEWTLIICFPFWCATLLKLFIVQVMIIFIVLYVALYTIIAPIVRDTMECLLESKHLNIESSSDSYRRHLN